MPLRMNSTVYGGYSGSSPRTGPDADPVPEAVALAGFMLSGVMGPPGTSRERGSVGETQPIDQGTECRILADGCVVGGDVDVEKLAIALGLGLQQHGHRARGASPCTP